MFLQVDAGPSPRFVSSCGGLLRRPRGYRWVVARRLGQQPGPAVTVRSLDDRTGVPRPRGECVRWAIARQRYRDVARRRSRTRTRSTAPCFRKVASPDERG